jgi:hypothetical protein
MALKWMAVVVAAVALTLCLTANVLVGTMGGKEVPLVLNMIAVTSAGVSIVLAIVAELYGRLTARITALTEFLVARLEELDTHTGDRNAGFVEGYLLSHGRDAEVVPIGPRMQSRRAMTGGDD